jgi:hypothetical protein
MTQSLDELLSVVYRYYPRRRDDDDAGYKDTEEHRRLVQARIQAGAEGNPWRNVLLPRIHARFPGHMVQDGSLHLPLGHHDAGYTGWFWLPPRRPQEKNHVIGFLISFLAPYYVVYSSVHVRVPSGAPRDWEQEIRFTFSPDEEPYARAITEELLSVFPDREQMPPEVGNIIVPDVVAGNQFMGETTLFHCLFTDAW